MIHFVVPAAHAAMMREYLELWGQDVADTLRIVPIESLVAESRVAPGTYVLAALDQLSSPLASFARAFHDSLAGRSDVRFLNHPTATLQRFALLETLHAAGRNTFRAIRITGDVRALQYPVFIRNADTHDGAISPLLQTPADLEAAIGRALVQGHPARSLMVVEFCDTADTDGYYRKYSAFVIGDHIVPRSLSYSRSWMLKFQGSEFSPRMAQEEQDYVLSNPHEHALREIFALAHVDYGRIDYACRDGRIQTWEINLNPTIGRGTRPSNGRQSPEVRAIRQPTKEHFYRRFREAWHDADLPSGEAPTIPLSIDPSLTRAALAVARPDGQWVAVLKRVLRPAKPIIEPVVRHTLPVIARVAIRRTRA